jgi:hypothetical protein
MPTEDTEQSDLEHYRQYLHGTPRQRGLALQGLSRTPLPSRELLAICETLLEDRTIALLSIPYSFGEIRWCAADAVASLRGVLKIPDPVVISNVFAPVSMDKALRLVKEVGIEKEGGLEGTIDALEVLAKMDCLPRRKITRIPEMPE